MRVFLDTNVLVAAFATRGLCADVLRLTLASHELVIGEFVLDELRGVLRQKIGLPDDVVSGIESLLREKTVVGHPERPSSVALADEDDRWVLASAVEAAAEVLVTGDRDFLQADSGTWPLEVMTPRAYWERLLETKPAGDR